MGLDFSVVPRFMDVILLGGLWTVAITVCAALLSFFGGIFFAVIALYAPVAIRLPFRAFEWVFMGTPLLLQLFLIYFGLPYLGYQIPSFLAAVIGLGLNGSAVLSEVFRSGIGAIHAGQREAAAAVGMTPAMSMRYIVLPMRPAGTEGWHTAIICAPGPMNSRNSIR